MDLFTIIATLVILGLCWYLINRFVPIAEPFKTIIVVVIVIVLVLWLLSLIGVGNIHIGSLRGR